MMTDQTDDAVAIRTARASQTKALADRDHEAAASIWTDDVTMRRALGQSIAGRSDYLAMVASADAEENPVIYQRVAVTVDVSDRWPLAYEEGRWSGHLGGADGPVVIAGRYAAQWVKRDGRWFIRSEAFVALTCEGAGCAFEALP